MPLSVGEHLGPYEILAPIGAGGMGEVYRAHDSRLHRDVAIKISNEQFSERFAREARAIAALNHTNVCHLYDVGPNYLVMEYVEGQDLCGPLDFHDALPIIQQLIDGIEAAHEKNIIHRDLKPANIKITPEGVVKILDFGLAKAMESTPSGQKDPGNSPTLTLDATVAGTILGTAAYMAPEQAKGKAADRRSDIWSFGVILHELLTGKRLFQGESTVEILGGVLNHVPDISAAPVRAHKLLRWCLERDRKRRLASISDARMLLEEEPPAETLAAAPEVVQQSTTKIRALSAIAALALIAATALAFLYFRTAPRPEEPVLKLSVLPPPDVSLVSESAPIISPDGKKLAFIARDASGKTLLWVRSLDSVVAQPVAGTEGARGPFWSPDSRMVAFNDQARLRRVDLAGGAPQTLCDTAGLGGTWSANGVILTGSAGVSPMTKMASGGGACGHGSELNRERQERGHWFPQFLPDGRHFLYLASSSRKENTGVMVGSLDSKETKFLFPSASQAVYAPPGFLLFLSNQTLMAQRFDADRLQLSGDPVPVAEQVAVSSFGDGMFSASSSGVLAFRSGVSGNSQLTWFDRSGKSLGAIGPVGDYINPDLSTDGKHIVFQRQGVSGDRDIWQMDVDHPVPQRFTFSPADETAPIFSPDGSSIVFASNREGFPALFQKPSSGAGTEQLLLKPEGDAIPIDWSKDGRFLIFRMANPKGVNEAWVLPMSGEQSERKAFGYLQSNDIHQNMPRLSPNGRWLACYITGAGRAEVALQSFPKLGGKWQVSTGGGVHERWSRDGKELFYLAPDGALMAASIKGETAPEIGAPVALFSPRILGGARLVQGYRTQYDVAPDGRFLINVPVDEASGSSMTVVLNWAAGLKK